MTASRPTKYSDSPMPDTATRACAPLAHYGPSEASGAIRAGLSVACIVDLQRLSGLPEDRLGRLLAIPRTTLLRRKKDGVLPPDEGDRVWRLWRIMARAVELFEGDSETARVWMNAPKDVFEGRTPLEFADTTPGAEYVLEVIGRLEHGIPV